MFRSRCCCCACNTVSLIVLLVTQLPYLSLLGIVFIYYAVDRSCEGQSKFDIDRIETVYLHQIDYVVADLG